MSNVANNSTSNETSTQTQKKRGRPEGAIREAFFSMSAIVNDELVHELIPVTRGEKITPEDMSAEARKIFLKKHKTDAESEIGPLFKASLMQTSTNKRQSVRLSEADINFSGRKIQAEFNGWEVLGRYVLDDSGKENTESVRLFYIKDLQKGEKARGKPHPTFKAINELKNIKEISTATVSA